jgi:hypothetical protein
MGHGEDNAESAASQMAHDEYCRAIEAYLCRRNEGHLIRIVGPAFETVCGWGEQGVPLKVVFRGIDRVLDRQQAKPGRRRPLRIEFCEADVLDVFDEWRRAVGVMLVRESSEEHLEDEGSKQRGSLKSHLERALARVGVLRGGGGALDEVLDRTDQALRDLVASGSLRGDARRDAIERLRALDTELLDVARGECDAVTLSQLKQEAALELAPFKQRMPSGAYEQSLDACVLRLIRERRQLPRLTFE